MLRRRLLIATLIIAVLVAICWLDNQAALSGVWLMPVGAVFVILATAELSDLFTAAGCPLHKGPVYLGNLFILLASWMPVVLGRYFYGEAALFDASNCAPWLAAIAWPFGAFVVCVLAVFLCSLHSFQKPGSAISSAAGSVFALAYLGLLFSFIVELRIVWGIGALVSLIIVVKTADSGAYFAGHFFGRHKLARRISPGKTVEGAVGAVLFACLAAWLSCRWIVPCMDTAHASLAPRFGWIFYGVILAIAGIFGDLAESLIKRDAQRKDSSEWLSGLGGVLDILDSLLLAAPAAWMCWAIGLM
ncbi:MAG: phosphatidate cytidylyltransferase [Thermoguttaceae bacterium]